jgi:hypothetical protein
MICERAMSQGVGALATCGTITPVDSILNFLVALIIAVGCVFPVVVVQVPSLATAVHMEPSIWREDK